MIEAGSKFGRWTVLGQAEDYVNPKGFHFRKYFVLCECGTKKSVRESCLIYGDSTSCGCYRLERLRQVNRTHGRSGHRLFGVWFDMNRRCFDQKRKDYIHYGGRGITVCDQWKKTPDFSGFEQFLIDMEHSYEEGLELERKDVNGNYCPENCTWVTRREQVINRRYFEGSKFNTNFIEFNGERLCISVWAERYGLSSTMLSDRISKLGWGLEKALTTPPKYDSFYILVNGELYNMRKVFKSSSNVTGYAKKLGLQTSKLLAGMFNGIADVVGVLNKEKVIIQATDDYTHLINKFKFNKEFAENFKTIYSSLDEKHFE